jgi:Bacterial Ig-like domain (group 2)
VTRRIGLLVLAAALGCSGLTESESGVVGIEVRVTGPDTVEVGESIQLSARPLDKNGDSAAAAVTWVSADTSATIDPTTGILTGVSPGTARVQASVGSLSSAIITFAVIPPADTLALAGDSVFTLPAGTTVSPALVTSLQSFHPAGVLAGRGVIYAITSPDPSAGPLGVTLANGLVVDTVLTGSDGTASNALSVVAGATPPPSVIVEVRAQRTRGAAVPGSGQRFTVQFQP